MNAVTRSSKSKPVFPSHRGTRSPLPPPYNRPHLSGKSGLLMYAYRPDKFASLYASDLGQRTWAFLIRPEQVARLETASGLGKPAVEGIEEQLLV